MPAPRKYRRPRRSLSSLRAERPSPKWWLIALILFSLLAHVLLVVVLVFVGRHTPKWKEPAQNPPVPQVNLVLQAPPPPTQRPEFIPTDAQAGVPPQKSPLISDHDAVVKSRSPHSRKPKSPLPDVNGKHPGSELHERPPSPASKPQPATPPTPRSQPQPPPPNPAKPTPVTKPEPPDPSQLKPDDHPEKTPSKEPAPKPAPPPQVDPNGLPVLPPIPAPTLAPQTPPTPPVQQLTHQASPASIPSFAIYQSDVAGASGAPGDNSPAAMATELGRYKARVYRAVGSRWYAKVGNQLQVLGVGTVHVTYTIYADGHLEITADPDAANSALMLLHSVSINSMMEAAPFGPFSDAMKKQVGDHYTDDFSFSIYGN